MWIQLMKGGAKCAHVQVLNSQVALKVVLLRTKCT